MTVVRVAIDLTDPVKAKEFVRWARTNKIKYSIPYHGYTVNVCFTDILQVVRWA